jgi:hypothetical protein
MVVEVEALLSHEAGAEDCYCVTPFTAVGLSVGAAMPMARGTVQELLGHSDVSDDGLYACAESRRSGGAESGGSAGVVIYLLCYEADVARRGVLD